MTASKKVLAAFLILVDFILIQYIVSAIPLRIDLTADQLYTLSDNSKVMLKKIEEPVTIDFFYSKSVADLPAWFKTFADRVEQMLEQYESAADGKIRLNVIDPKPDTPEEERAIAAGVHSIEIPTGDRVFLGMVALQGDTEIALPYFNWERERFLEYDVSQVIYQAQLLTKPRLGLITSLPLQAPPYPTMPGQPQQEDQFFVEQLSAQYELEAIDPTAESIPSDIDILVIVHPKDLSPELTYSIDQYALSGRPIFLAVDPSSVQEREQNRQMQMMGQNVGGSASDLPELLEAWGVEYDASAAIVDPVNSIAQGNFVQPAWLVFRDEYTNRDLLPSSELEGLVLLEAGVLKAAENASTTLEPVLTTSDQAATVQSMMLQFSQANQLAREGTPLDGPATVAGLLSGTAKTAFPDGPPNASNPDDTEVPETLPESHLEEGKLSVFIVADTDFLLDRFSIQKVNFFGMQQVQKQNDNQALAANFIEFLGGSRDLIGIRGKGTIQRDFDVVTKMEQEAQQVYQAKLQAVEDRLTEINSKLSQLASEQTESGTIYITPEMQKVIDDFRNEEAAAKAERREIRRELRQGIESLGNVLGTVNLIWAPLALLAFGIMFNRMRKR